MRKILRLAFLLENLVENERHGRRLADAGGAENGEVLAQEFLEIDIGGHRGVEAQVADLDRFAGVDAMDEADVLTVQARNAVADHRIVGDAALEECLFRLIAPDLAHEIDVGDEVAGIFLAGLGGLDVDADDHADDQ